MESQSCPPSCLPDIEGSREGGVSTRVTNEGGVLPLFVHPRMSILIPKACGVLLRAMDGNALGLACSDKNLAETLQLFKRPPNAGQALSNIDLNNFSAINISNVVDTKGHSERILGLME